MSEGRLWVFTHIYSGLEWQVLLADLPKYPLALVQQHAFVIEAAVNTINVAYITFFQVFSA